MPKLDPRDRKVKILATTGPACSDSEMLRRLFLAGADAFRVNMSHGEHEVHARTIANIRALEKEFHRPIAILADLQGPKLRVGTFKDGRATIPHGATFIFDRQGEPGDATRVELPHPEIFHVVEEGQRLLVNDGKIRLRVKSVSNGQITCKAEVGGVISDRKGVNVPDAEIPIPALTDKDRRDLSFAMDHGVDWIGLSFVQRPDDIAEARKLMGPRGALCAKIEKPQAVRRLGEIIELADGIMVARGDLGVELEPQEVPPLQKKIVNATRLTGKPVIVATQMLESMIESPAPTRAEVSDVANAVYDGADVVMLSAETAAGDWPEEAVMMMDSIARQVEKDEGYKSRVRMLDTPPDPTLADALAHACMTIADTVKINAIAVFTSSGSSARRVARERPAVPVMVMTPSVQVARRVALLWGGHPVATKDIGSFEEMIAKGKRMALRHGFAEEGTRIAMLAGVPFGQAGATNLVHVVTVQGDELENYKG
ncbi:pyruvate kinase [Aurantiacibacter poecillastricola]|uniref:pyruvate kinase n=1 Tax=Aurantiacibacter poecillastricola TaxID=3064385 RepID=UPI00273F976B|nr:pyruvate kinase [Aurantiacibacter sp. 219JJ12-13]MDP5260839.1 pyruvate kinase [Aurantiacibacter sp. 219JJ12-13]